MVMRGRLTLLAVVMGLMAVSGCTADPRDVYHAVKQIEPDAEKRNKEVRELTGVPPEMESQ